MQPFEQALGALRAAALTSDRESLVFAEGKVAILPDSPYRAAALGWLDRAVVNAEAGFDPELVREYAGNALREFEEVRTVAVQYKAAYQRYQAVRAAYEADPTDEGFDLIRSALAEADRLRDALVDAT